jgi:hypothetical protein
LVPSNAVANAAIAKNLKSIQLQAFGEGSYPLSVPGERHFAKINHQVANFGGLEVS